MRSIFLCGAMLLAAGALPAADDLPKAETILDKYIEVTGGKAAYEKRHTGVEQVDGKDCYKVQLTPKEGMAMTRFYDKQSNLLVKMVMTVKNPMGEFPVESKVSDYRKEGDILMPHKVSQSAAGQEIMISI